MRHGWPTVPASFFGLLLFLGLSGAGPGTESALSQVTILDEHFGSRTAPILLLARPDVQIDLQLDARQVAGARRTIQRLIERGLSLKNESGPAVEEERRRIDEEMIDWFSRALTKRQLERLRQVNLQWEGAAALTRPHVRWVLELTEPQRLAIDQLLRQFAEARRARGHLTAAEVGHYSGQAMAVLSPTQKNLWDHLLGPPCHFSIGGPTVPTRDSTGPRGPDQQAQSGR